MNAGLARNQLLDDLRRAVGLALTLNDEQRNVLVIAHTFDHGAGIIHALQFPGNAVEDLHPALVPRRIPFRDEEAERGEKPGDFFLSRLAASANAMLRRALQLALV